MGLMCGCSVHAQDDNLSFLFGSLTACLTMTTANMCSGYYDPAASETSYWESDDFTETYVSGASGYPILNGSWYNDTVGIGSASLYNAQFGVANQSYQTVGVLGLGYGSLESSTKEYYKLVLQSLVMMCFLRIPYCRQLL